MLPLINATQRPEPFDHADWVFEAKFDGFRAAADTVRGRLLSRNRNRMKRYGHVFDGELVVLDDARRPLFNELLFGRRRPTYVAFDLLIADGGWGDHPQGYQRHGARMGPTCRAHGLEPARCSQGSTTPWPSRNMYSERPQRGPGLPSRCTFGRFPGIPSGPSRPPPLRPKVRQPTFGMHRLMFGNICGRICLLSPHYSGNPIRQGKMMGMFTGLPAAQVLDVAGQHAVPGTLIAPLAIRASTPDIKLGAPCCCGVLVFVPRGLCCLSPAQAVN
jgi:hypothetical protein